MPLKRPLALPPLFLLLLLPLLLSAVLSISPQPLLVSKALAAAKRAENNAQPAEAAQALRQVAALQPWRTDLLERIGHLEMEAGNFEAAIAAFETAGERSSLAVEARLELGESYRLAGDQNSALQIWMRLAGEENPPAEAFQRLADLQRARGELEAATITCRAWQAAYPDDPLAVYLLGLMLTVQSPAEALMILRDAAAKDESVQVEANVLMTVLLPLAENPENAEAWLELGRSLAKLRDWDLASLAFQQAVQRDPHYAEAWAFWGEARSQLGRDGLEQFQRAYALNPDSALTRAFMALYWRRRGDMDRALLHIRAATQIEPEQAAWQLEMGDILVHSGDIQSALAHYLKAAELEPDDPFYWRMLARFCVVQDIQIRSVGLPAARRVLAASPQDAAALGLMGWVLLNLEDYASAERFLQQALRQDAEHAPTHLHLGQLYLQLSAADDAYHHLKRAAELAGQDVATGMMAERLLERYFGVENR